MSYIENTIAVLCGGAAGGQRVAQIYLHLCTLGADGDLLHLVRRCDPPFGEQPPQGQLRQQRRGAYHPESGLLVYINSGGVLCRSGRRRLAKAACAPKRSVICKGVVLRIFIKLPYIINAMLCGKRTVPTYRFGGKKSRAACAAMGDGTTRKGACCTCVLHRQRKAAAARQGAAAALTLCRKAFMPYRGRSQCLPRCRRRCAAPHHPHGWARAAPRCPARRQPRPSVPWARAWRS